VNEARAVAVLGLFVLGMLGGVGVHQLVDRGPAENPYVSLPKTDEPRVAHDVVYALGNDDARSLAKLLNQEQLNALGSALDPIVDIRSTSFVGAVESEGRYLSAYVVKGKDTSGTDFVVGFVLRVANDQVVGVN
jgi:hypothetical protein